MVGHRSLQELLGEDEFKFEKEIVWNGGPVPIRDHPDAIHKESGTVIEFKTTESTRILEEGPYPHHLRQLKSYMSILDAAVGKLSYILMGYFKGLKEYFPEHLVTLEENEKKEILSKLERDAAELQYGIAVGRPELVQHITKDPEYINQYGYNWMCSSCPYRKECEKMRAEAGECS